MSSINLAFDIFFLLWFSIFTGYNVLETNTNSVLFALGRKKLRRTHGCRWIQKYKLFLFLKNYLSCVIFFFPKFTLAYATIIDIQRTTIKTHTSQFQKKKSMYINTPQQIIFNLTVSHLSSWSQVVVTSWPSHKRKITWICFIHNDLWIELFVRLAEHKLLLMLFSKGAKSHFTELKKLNSYNKMPRGQQQKNKKKLSLFKFLR